MYPNIRQGSNKPPPPPSRPRNKSGVPNLPANYHDSNARVQGFGHGHQSSQKQRRPNNNPQSQYYLSSLSNIYFDWEMLSKDSNDKRKNLVRNKHNNKNECNLTDEQLMKPIARTRDIPVSLTFDV